MDHRPRDRGAQALGAIGRQIHLHPDEEDRKFLAADAADDILGPELPDQGLADHPEGAIAGDVAEPVVHLLEEVEVDIEQRSAHALARERHEPADEGLAVQHAGQPIRLGALVEHGVKPLELALGRFYALRLTELDRPARRGDHHGRNGGRAEDESIEGPADGDTDACDGDEHEKRSQQPENERLQGQPAES